MDNIYLEYTNDFQFLRRADIAKFRQFNMPRLEESKEIIATNEGNLKELGSYLEQCRREQKYCET